MRLLVVFLAVSLLACVVVAQERVPCRVRFRDKGPSDFVPGSSLYEQTLSTYHPRAIERRSAAGMRPVLTVADQPIYAPYKKQVLAISDSLRAELIWFNAIIVSLDSVEQQRVAALPFVAGVKPTRSLSYDLTREIDCSPSAYGPSGQQLSTVAVKELHDAGVFGQGARIGIIDNGFAWRDMSTLRHANVEREYDFIYRDTITASGFDEAIGQDAHGSMIFSVIGGWSHDSITGVAPFATYLLAKSEDMRYERRIEEELYAEAMQWLERNGADIASSSLGYLVFDTTDVSTPYELLDGKTTYAARAINFAAERGMLCVTAASNSGPKPRTLSTPADADSAITVGAMAVAADTLWWFSSRGPTADGRIKPDITAQGMGVYCQTPIGNMVRSSGTSLATPLVAGQLALLRSLYPDLPLHQLRSALYANSMFPITRDSGMGHGVASTLKAVRSLGPGIGRPNIVIVGSQTGVFVPVFSNNPVRLDVLVTNRASQEQWTLRADAIEAPWFFLEFPSQTFNAGDTLDVRFVATDNVKQQVRTYPYDQASVTVVKNFVDLSCAVRLPQSITTVKDVSDSREMLVYGQPIQSGAHVLLCSSPFPEGAAVSTRVHAYDGHRIQADVQHEGDKLCVTSHQPLERGVYVLTVEQGQKCSTVSFVVY